jgi:hypothetical protein
MSAQSIRLANILLNEFFGDLVSEVGLILLKNGKQTLKELVEESKLKKIEVQKCLLVLIQHGLVSHQVQNSSEVYSFLINVLLRWMAFPNYISISKLRFGDVCELIVEDLLRNGRSLLSEVVERLSSRMQRGLEDRGVAETIKTSFLELVENYCVMRGEVIHHELSSGEGGGEVLSPPTGGMDLASNRFQPLPQNVMENIGVRKRKRSHEDKEEGEQSAKKMKKTESDDQPADSGVYWIVNTDKFEQLILHEKVIGAVTRRIDTVAANIVKGIFSSLNPAFCGTIGDSDSFHVLEVMQQLPSAMAVTQAQVEQYFKVLSEEKFIKRTGDTGGGAFVVGILFQSFLSSFVYHAF